MLERGGAEVVLWLRAGTEEPVELSRSWAVATPQGLAWPCLLVFRHPVHQALGGRGHFSLYLKLHLEKNFPQS